MRAHISWFLKRLNGWIRYIISFHLLIDIQICNICQTFSWWLNNSKYQIIEFLSICNTSAVIVVVFLYLTPMFTQTTVFIVSVEYIYIPFKWTSDWTDLYEFICLGQICLAICECQSIIDQQSCICIKPFKN